MSIPTATNLDSPVIVANWYDERLNDEIPRRFASRRHLLEEMIDADTAAAHSGTLLTDILADDYDGDRDAMAAAIGTDSFDGYNVLPGCPRCDGLIPNNVTPGLYPGALSRRDNKTEICSACGQDEALADFLAAG